MILLQGIDCLRGMPLTWLDVRNCYAVMSREGFEILRDLPLTSLKFAGDCFVPEYDYLQGPGLSSLAGLPLTALDLEECDWVTDASVEQLSVHRLTDLSMTRCNHPELSNASLAHLRGMPLSRLILTSSHWLTAEGLAHLVGLPLSSLCLAHCRSLSNSGLQHLKAMPLTILNLRACGRLSGPGGLSDACMEHLRGLPLAELCLFGNGWLTGAGLQCLRRVSSLTRLDLGRCPRLTGHSLKYLCRLPLKNLDLSGREGVHNFLSRVFSVLL